MTTSIILPEPTVKLVDEFLNEFRVDSRSNFADNAIRELIKKFPDNKTIESVILKISVINDLYSTNIFSTYEIANHILQQDFDKAIENKDYSIVNRVATGHKIKSSRTYKEYNFYSFATKYCNWHDQSSFPLFDRYIDLVLINYNHKNQYTKETNFRVYENLINVLMIFRTTHKLDKYSFKELDKFLWYLGKKSFKKDEKISPLKLNINSGNNRS